MNVNGRLLFTSFVTLLFSCNIIGTQESERNERNIDLEVKYQWTFVNFTWESQELYKEAITTQQYIPLNNIITAMSYYKGKFYLVLPKLCPGVPVTLGYISADDLKTNPLVVPFPNWSFHDLASSSCDKLESVSVIEIDSHGAMWIVDGNRETTNARCPPKLMQIDLNNNKIVHTFIFPEEICLSKGGRLTAIVLDDSDGDYAYIADASDIDPGLIVYSRKNDHAWKLRDATMFPVNDIGLSSKSSSRFRYVYYTAFTGLSFYFISTDILKNEELSVGGTWRYNVTFLGKAVSSTHSITTDNNDNFYYGLIEPIYGLGKWKASESFSNSEIIYQNRDNLLWISNFTFDNEGHLDVLSVSITIHDMASNNRCTFDDVDEYRFKIFRTCTGTKSYLN